MSLPGIFGHGRFAPVLWLGSCAPFLGRLVQAGANGPTAQMAGFGPPAPNPGGDFAGNARLASRTFGVPLGTLTVGAAADFVVRPYDPPTPLSADNWWGHFLFGIANAPVARVIVGGEELVRDGHPVHFDAARVWHECRVRAKELWARW